MLRFILPLITFFFLLLSAPALAYACEGAVETQSLWQAVGEHALTFLVTLLTPIFLVFVNKGIKLFEQKTKIDIAERHEALINMCISSGIAYAHEQGRKALKADAEPAKGEEKKIMAMETAMAKLQSLGVLEQDADALARLIDARLNQERKDPKEKGRMER